MYRSTPAPPPSNPRPEQASLELLPDLRPTAPPRVQHPRTARRWAAHLEARRREATQR
jgi:hypothetical protein